ncbi:MAG: hypothetical protein IKV92_02920 [Akkermansia sp.]|nr:hypothetical protein [Akkermansia sp.]
MNKFFTLLSLASIACITVSAEETVPAHQYWHGEEEMIIKNKPTNGTWTIGISLNVEALKNLPQGKKTWWGGTDYSKTGNPLFTVTGDGYYTKDNGSNTEQKQYSNRNVTVTMGWGGNWYKGIEDTVEGLLGIPFNGVGEGLQLGVTSEKDAHNLSGGGLISNGFDVYVADMKIQKGENGVIGENGGIYDGDNGSYDWSISEGEKSACTTLDDIATMTTIDDATLFIVHTYASGPNGQLATDTDRDYASNDGNYATDITYTTFYLTVTGKDINGKDVVYNFMGQNDDSSSNDYGEGSILGGSCWYDVDVLEQISGINTNLVDSLVFISSAVPSAERDILISNGLIIPEPTTATLSLMALAALAARRRRR